MQLNRIRRKAAHLGAKHMREITFFNTKYARLVIIPVIALFYYILSYMMDPFSKQWDYYVNYNFVEILSELFFTFIFIIIIYEGSIYISKWLNGHFPWDRRPASRLIIQSLVQLSFVMLLIYVLHYILQYFFPDYGTEKEMIVYILQLTIVSVVISLLISAVHTGRFLLLNWKTSGLEAAELKLKAAATKQLSLQAELHSLKTQLDPHFLFNNFSVLLELIDEDKKLAKEFLQNLSKIYRYFLINAYKDLVTLKEELTFIDSYIYLMKIRHEEAIEFKIEVPEEYHELSLPPVTLQLLVENAIKHNQSKKSNPLKIHIYIGPARKLIVANSYIPLNQGKLASGSSGLGLKNINSRYKILSEELPSYEQDEKLFTVHLPLLNLNT